MHIFSGALRRFLVLVALCAASVTPAIAQVGSWSAWNRWTGVNALYHVEHRHMELNRPFGTLFEWRVANASSFNLTIVIEDFRYICRDGSSTKRLDPDWVIAENLGPGQTKRLDAGRSGTCAGSGGVAEVEGTLTHRLEPDPWSAFRVTGDFRGVKREMRSRELHEGRGTDFEFRFTNRNSYPVDIFLYNLAFQCKDGPDKRYPDEKKWVSNLAPDSTTVVHFNRMCAKAGGATKVTYDVGPTPATAPPEPTAEQIAAEFVAKRAARLKTSYRIHLMNRCKRPLDIAVVYRDANTGGWSNKAGAVTLTRITATQMLVVDGPITGTLAQAYGEDYYVYYKVANSNRQVAGTTPFKIKDLGETRNFVKVTAAPSVVNGARTDVTDLVCN